MPLRAHVHVVIWVQDQLVIHRRSRGGTDHVALPGGRVKDRESITDALRREVSEEIDRQITIHDLLFAGEVTATSRQDLVLIFAADLRAPTDPEGLDLIDPLGAEAEAVLPPVLSELVSGREAASDCRPAIWLGNLYASQPAPRQVVGAHLARSRARRLSTGT